MGFFFLTFELYAVTTERKKNRNRNSKKLEDTPFLLTLILEYINVHFNSLKLLMKRNMIYIFVWFFFLDTILCVHVNV